MPYIRMCQTGQLESYVKIRRMIVKTADPENTYPLRFSVVRNFYSFLLNAQASLWFFM
jgi:hypothetical protein